MRFMPCKPSEMGFIRIRNRFKSCAEFLLNCIFPLNARLMKRLKENLLNMTTIGRDLSVQKPPDGRLHTNEQFPFIALESNPNGEQVLLCLMYCKWIGFFIAEYRVKCIELSERGGIVP